MEKSEQDSLLERFQGSLLGLMTGDALGGKFEGQTAEYIRNRFYSIDALMDYPSKSLWYTDDTQMMIGVAEALLKDDQIKETTLCERFVANYMPSRGYGRGARAVIEAMEEGSDYHFVANTIFPGGSYGNGAAMRVAPIGLFFRNNLKELLSQAELSAKPTHTHPLGIEGAKLLAATIGFISQKDKGTFETSALIEFLLPLATSSVFKEKIELLNNIETASDLISLGNGIAAQESVVTSIGCFLNTPNSFKETIGNAIFLGGDTDTIAAMAGAISGAYLGIKAIPEVLYNKLENSPVGRDFVLKLAMDLTSASLSISR